jgi:glycyl-tRNA synthetase
MDLMEKVVSLCKRRGFVFPGSEIYGGVANTWDFGPLGLALKNNIKNLWWKRFVEDEENVYGIDGGIILSPKVWESSGHVANFTDPLMECMLCHKRFREDQVGKVTKCPECSGQLTEPKMFNGMFRTFLGATEDSKSVAYLRPETAQAIFINFKNIIDSFHPKLPFGIAQIGKSFRNELTAGNFIFRDIEFEQLELEYFIDQSIWEETYVSMLTKMKKYLSEIGVDMNKIHEREHDEKERSHYSKKTVDLEYDFPFGTKEVWGLAYRSDYDLKNHSEKSGVDLKIDNIFPHVVEPSVGVERLMITVLCSAYYEDEKRMWLKLPPKIAPFKVAIFPLVANKPDLTEKAREIYRHLKLEIRLSTAWDDRGNIGKRYYAQDEIGTPWCVTVDYQTLEDKTVTVRDRDTTKQDRISIDELDTYFINGLK